MRAFSTSMMVLLVVAALFWGNCFSCPQVLLAADGHACCHHTKAPKNDCKTQGLRNFVKAEKAAAVASMPAAVMAVAPPAAVEAADLATAPRHIPANASPAVPLRI